MGFLFRQEYWSGLPFLSPGLFPTQDLICTSSTAGGFFTTEPPGKFPICVPSCSVVYDSLQPCGLGPTRLLCPWGFSRQEYCSGFPCPPPGDLPNPGIKPRSPALRVDSLPLSHLGSPQFGMEKLKGFEHKVSNNILKVLLPPICSQAVENSRYYFRNMC